MIPIWIALVILHSVSATEFPIRSDQDFLTAINTVRPGDVIHLYRDTIYYLQNVELTRSGLPNLPITLNGERGTKITSDNVGLVVRGSYWKIQNIAFENSQTGLVVLGNNNTLRSLSFHEIEEEGLVLRGNGNVIRNSAFNGATHGVVISGRDNTLFKNTVSSLVTSVTVTPRSCCGRLEGNVFNGLLNLLGGEYTLAKNIANSDVSVAGQRNHFLGNVINGRLDVSGCGNTFMGNTAGVSDFTSTCYNWDDGNNHFGGSLGAVVSDTNGANYQPGQPGQPGYPEVNQKPGKPGRPGSGHQHQAGAPGAPGGVGYPQGNYKPGSSNSNYLPGQPSAVSYPQGSYKPGKPGSGNYKPGSNYRPSGSVGNNYEPGSNYNRPDTGSYPQSNVNRPSINFKPLYE